MDFIITNAALRRPVAYLSPLLKPFSYLSHTNLLNLYIYNLFAFRYKHLNFSGKLLFLVKIEPNKATWACFECLGSRYHRIVHFRRDNHATICTRSYWTFAVVTYPGPHLSAWAIPSISPIAASWLAFAFFMTSASLCCPNVVTIGSGIYASTGH